MSNILTVTLYLKKNCNRTFLKPGIYVYDNLIKNVDKDCFIFLDISKAFDTVDHHILLWKLKNYFGIRENSLNLIRQYTKISNNFSDELEINCGVP